MAPLSSVATSPERREPRLLGQQIVDGIARLDDDTVFNFPERVSMKPYSLTRACVARELMRPAFGPSGVSIGQRRPYEKDEYRGQQSRHALG